METGAQPEGDPPVWKEGHPPVLKELVIQANAQVALLQASEDSRFDYGLPLSTWERGQPLLLPVQLAAYPRAVLAGKTLNPSTTLTRKRNGWWLTRSAEEGVSIQTPKDAPVIGVDVGIANFITASEGQQYGTFPGKVAARPKRDREKRRRKTKLRACLKRKGVTRLPSPRTKNLARTVRQEINRAVHEWSGDHPDAQIAYEQLNVAGMQFKARRMNAYLDASNLAHLPEHLAWGALKRAMRARKVKSAYSSQECHRGHAVARANRPNQQTFCSQVCGQTTHAAVNAAEHLASRLGETELQACQHPADSKALLARRHQEWHQQTRLAVVQPPAQLWEQRA